MQFSKRNTENLLVELEILTTLTFRGKLTTGKIGERRKELKKEIATRGVSTPTPSTDVAIQFNLESLVL